MASENQNSEPLPAYDARKSDKPEKRQGHPVILVMHQHAPCKANADRSKLQWGRVDVLQTVNDVVLIDEETTLDELRAKIAVRLEYRFKLRTRFDKLPNLINVQVPSHKTFSIDSRVHVNENNWDAVSVLLERENTRLEFFFRDVEASSTPIAKTTEAKPVDAKLANTKSTDAKLADTKVPDKKSAKCLVQ